MTLRPDPAVRDVAETTKTDAEPDTVADTGVVAMSRLLRAVSGERTGRDLRLALGLKHNGHFRKAFSIPALKAGLLEMTVSDRPRSRNQRYRLSRTGREFLAAQAARRTEGVGVAK